MSTRQKEKHEKTTVTVRLTDEEDQVLSRLCILKKTSKTGYLARLAKEQAKRELLGYAAEEYLGGRASLSELAKKTAPAFGVIRLALCVFLHVRQTLGGNSGDSIQQLTSSMRQMQTLERGLFQTFQSFQTFNRFAPVTTEPVRSSRSTRFNCSTALLVQMLREFLETSK